MRKFIKPDYKNSIVNVSASLAEYFGADNDKPTLKVLDDALNIGHNKVVFMLFDGMGTYPLEKNLSENDFVRKNVKAVITSTFPSTTTNATTSLNTNRLPLEHGWFGWIGRFENIGKNVVLFLHKDAISSETVSDGDYPIAPCDDYWFNHAVTDYEISTVMPSFCKGCTKYPENRIVARSVRECFDGVKKVLAKSGRQFVYAYCPYPDETMHDYGVTSAETKKVIEEISAGLENLKNTCDDALFIVTADHGQTDVEGFVEFYKDKELNDMLLCPPYLEARAPAFKVKRGFKAKFYKLFTERYGDDFKLFRSSDLIKKGYFGDRGSYGYLLGDFIAVGTYTNKLFMWSDKCTRFKGHHTSLTDEMTVPLVIFESQKH